MKKLMNYGNEFIKQSDWKDVALIKLCLCAIGMMLGMTLPKKVRKPAAFIAVTVFIFTYIPLILKLLRIMNNEKCKKYNF